MRALTLYAAPTYSGAPLFEVVLDAVGEEINYTPPLDVITMRLEETITMTVTEVNAIPGLKVGGMLVVLLRGV